MRNLGLSKKVNFLTIAASMLFTLSACSTQQNDLDAQRGAGSRLSSVSMPVSGKLKPYMGPGKIDAWSLSVVGGACANGAIGVSHLDKFGVFGDSDVLLDAKITSGCDYKFTLSLGKANPGRTKLEAIYLTNDIDGKRTELNKEQTLAAKVPVNITLYFTEDGQKVFGEAPDSSLQTNPEPTPSPTPTPAPEPAPENPPAADPNCYKGDARICRIELLIAQKTNAYRRNQGMADLSYDAKVGFVSRDWSMKQAANGGIGHGGFPGSRSAVYYQEFGSSIGFSGENVAYNSCNGSQSEESVANAFVNQWWNSSPHRRNMLGWHSDIGVGIHMDRYGRCYGTQLFR